MDSRDAIGFEIETAFRKDVDENSRQGEGIQE
jgi:hypothetical protein